MGTQQKMTPRPIRNAWLTDPVYDVLLNHHFHQVQEGCAKNYFGFIYRWGSEYDQGRIVRFSSQGGRRSHRVAFTHRATFTYVEGFALPYGQNVAVPHAWCLDSEGKIMELTWDSLGTRYFGVPFVREFLDQCVQRTGWDGIIGDWMARHNLRSYWDNANEIIAT